MAIQSFEEYQNQVKAEVALNFPEEAQDGFMGGVTGNHQSFGSWFTSGLTGLIGSKGFNDETQRNWYIQRNSIQFGKKQLEDVIRNYEEVSKYRELNPEETARYTEAKRRNDLITRDLNHVFNTKAGDLDAPIDVKGQSFNQRWGIEPENEDLLKQLVAHFKEDPAYMGGVFTAEIIKDLPLSVLAYLGLGAKAGAGFKGINTALNKLNNIQPKVLRGITKLGTGVAVGSGIGAGYEAAYTGLEQGDIKTGNVKAGAAFGGVFGILAGLGIMSRTAKDLKTRQDAATPVKPTPEININETVKRAVTPEETNEAIKPFTTMFKQHNEKLFPELKENVDYKIVNSLSAAKKEGVLNVNKNKAAQLRQDKNGNNYIVLNPKEIDSSHANLVKEINKGKDMTYFSSLSPLDIALMKKKEFIKPFLLAHELAHIEQNRILTSMGRDAKSLDANQNLLKERDANNRAIEEMRRSYKEIQQTASDRNASEILSEFEARATRPDELPLEGKGAVSRASDFLEQRPNVQRGAALGSAALTYGLTGEEGDPTANAAAVGLAVGLGPKAYRAVTKPLNKVVLEAKRQVAQNIELNANLSKQWEARGQMAQDKLAAYFNSNTPSDGWNVINTIEGVKGINLNKAQQDLVTDIQELLEVIGKEAKDTKLIGNYKDATRLEVKGTTTKAYGSLLHNYFPHLFYNPHLLSDLDIEQLVKVYGKIDDRSALQRNIKGTLEDINTMIQEGKLNTQLQVVSPDRALGAYIQGMSRAIVGRRLLNSMKDFDLKAYGENKGAVPAVLASEDFNTLKKAGHFNKQDVLHYSTLKHPALDGYHVHTNVKNSLDDFFVVANREGIVGTMEKVLRLNNQLKRVAVFGSMFHGSALVASAIYSMGLSGAIKGIGGKGKTRAVNPTTGERELVDWSNFKLGTGEFNDLSKQWIGWGLQIVNVKKQDLLNPGKIDLDPVLNRAGPAGKGLMKGFDAIDYATWEYLHDRFKLAAAMRQKEKLMFDTRFENGRFKRVRNNISDEFASRKAADFANDAYGSLDWNNFATNLYTYAARNPDKIRGKAAALAAEMLPVNKRRWLNLGLFAPDWTIANIMIVGKTFTGAYKYSKEFLKAFHKGNTAAWRSKEGKELLKAWNLYAAYSMRAGIYTSAMWWAITEKFSSEEPTFEKWWDFWGGEQSGKLDLGDGESMVISKQIAEPVHWIQHPMHTLMNKGAIVPKTLLELMFNKQWFSLKKGLPLGPRIVEDDGTTHYGQWILGKTIPIAYKPLIDDNLDWDERVSRVISGFVGLPQFGDPASTTK